MCYKFGFGSDSGNQVTYHMLDSLKNKQEFILNSFLHSVKLLKRSVDPKVFMMFRKQDDLIK